MNKRLSRAVVAFAFTLLFTAMIGIVAVGLRTAADRAAYAKEQTATRPIYVNETTVAFLHQTQMAATNLAATLTTLPYEPTLYALRRTVQYEIIASMGPTEAEIFDLTETALVATYRGTETPVTPGPCFFNWARQNLPDVAKQARTSLDEADLSKVEVRYVEAYGENCFEPNGQTVRYFAAMTTDFYLSVSIDMPDEENQGQMVEETYNALITIPRDDLPARPGYLDFIFTAEGQEKRLRVMFDEVKAALDEGAHGAALWAALNP